MITWFCMGCNKNIGNRVYCPYCGMQRLGNIAMGNKKHKTILGKIFKKKPKGIKQPMFSKEQCFIYGIHPNDEMYRKTMELDILSKNYKQ